ncbi:MAG: phosphate propanoyltransferase [Elusimicrobia bacterium]|nr:phosphate propanoyltransferase [Elusimicrobiota bacterium]
MAFQPGLAAGIADEISRRLTRSGIPITVGVSNRHLHLSAAHFESLFGSGAVMGVLRPLGQPGQFASSRTVDLEGPKGRVKGVRVLGPARSKTQIEVSLTDARTLGIDPPLRQSGSLDAAAGVRLLGPAGSVEAPGSVIIAQRHLHVHTSDAARLGLKDNEVVRVRVGGPALRPVVFENVVARVSDLFALEFHVDTDEANAAWVKTGDVAYIV